MIGKHYVLTGGTSGLGYAILKQLIGKGAHVTVLARNPNKLRQISSNQVTVIKCDLQLKQNIVDLKTHFSNHKIDGIIYSSGVGYFKSIEEHSEEEMIETYTLNAIHFNLLLSTLRPCLSQHPTIVGIGSQSAFLTQAHAAHYGASKSAFNQILNALRIEHQDYHVLTVNTGPIATPFHEKADPTLNYAKKYQHMMLDADDLAIKIIQAMIHHKKEINEPKWMHIMLKVYNIAPRFFENNFTFLFNNKKRE
ncbi:MULTISPECIES: SDR family NAD(P)-dependent oxidoreductase [Staphylococcus]|uniref:SDR family NAD(P)-dependent oxidoreductase n=1 Tax=Staphylococcus hsinchuensis TaxID=3051183 RepID=A0ABZ3ECF2_9STAP|nr:SDR family NAD(P)-dependent oxidoreductase [Staphylococcus sp. Marseille-Q6910]